MQTPEIMGLCSFETRFNSDKPSMFFPPPPEEPATAVRRAGARNSACFGSVFAHKRAFFVVVGPGPCGLAGVVLVEGMASLTEPGRASGGRGGAVLLLLLLFAGEGSWW